MARDINTPITEDEFITAVAQAARSGWDQAVRATRATLETLADRIDAGEARDLAVLLPDTIAPYVGTTTSAQRFGVDEFLRRVAEREGVDLETARRHVRAVLTVLQRAIGPQEFADLSAELPKDFAALLPQGPYVEVISADLFIQRVADRAATDADEARRAIDAVLETLAMRIAGGEVDDLRARLPVEFHAALERGKELSGGKAMRMSLDDFVRRVADQEGTSRERALEHVSAVLRTVREAVGEQEFLDVTSQLPAEYEALVRR
jgi:uncharacterized protein (DUF2267 family)